MKPGLCSRARAARVLIPVLALLLGSTGAARAQGVTTAAVTGTVTGEQGQPVSGVQIVVTNIPTGTVQGTLTRADGRYLLPGLRPGGPYRIEARAIGYAPAVREGVTLSLSQTERIDFSLVTQAVALAGVEVVADRDAIISRGRTGTTSVVTEETIERAPTITRDFTDFTRLVPQVTTSGSGTSAAGRNNRFNNIQIDGAVNNDLFGLAASGTPGGQADARPITLEAIQEFQVVLAPFDVRQGGFTGAGINAVTRGGTNDFRGSIAYFGRNENFVGRFVDQQGQVSQPVEEFQQSDLAFSLGGPIVQDRAHFFVAGEASRRQNPLGAILGVNTRVDESHVRRVFDFVQSNYGFDPGGFGQESVGTRSNNLFARVDLIPAQGHRLTLRHNFVDAEQENIDRGIANFGYSRSGHTFFSTTNSTVAQLNSNFGNRFFNEFRVGLTSIRDRREVGDPFPRVSMEVPGTRGSITLGPNEFSGRNALDQDVLELTNDFNFALGRHNLTLGTTNEFFRFSNLFVRNPFGNYEFDSIEDFEAGNAWRYQYSFLRPGGDERAEFPARRLAFYLQDRWDVADNFVVTAGLRYDLAQLPRDPKFNLAVLEAVGRRTDEVPSNSGLFNPRLGFNWDVRGDQSTQLRGGTGLFSGRTPFVWISNAYGNTGLDYVRFTCDAGRDRDRPVPAFNPDPFNQPTSCVPGAETPIAPNEINLADPDFRFPQVWRSSLAIDQRLPFGFIGTLEGLYSQTRSDVLYQNLAIERAPGTQLVEGRPQFVRRDLGSFNISDVILITNTDQGYNYSVTAQVQRPFRGGWDFSAAYTLSDAFDVNRVGSSQAISNWRFNLTPDDPNNPPLTRSNFVVRHRVLMSGSYDARIIPRLPTNVSLVYIGEAGQPYSYVYSGDVNGDRQRSNDLVYVPRDQSEIRFAPQTDRDGNVVISPEQAWQNLNSFIEQVPCLQEARGTIIERGACRSPWFNRFDLRVAQNVETFGRQRAQITLDILNVANLLNRNWGRQEFISFESDTLLRLARGSQPDAQGRHLYEAFPGDTRIYSIANVASRYQLQLGVRYIF